MESISQQSMKTKILVVAFLGLMSHGLTAASLIIDEMVFKIQDSTTGKPLTGVYIYRDITTVYYPFLTGFIEGKRTAQAPDYAITNSDGVAIFPKRNVPRKKYNEAISWITLKLNFNCDKNYDQNDAFAHARALGESEQKAGDIFSKNRINDALGLSLTDGDPREVERYSIIRTTKPRHEYVRIGLKYDFREPYKTIVIKLGNASIVENGIKTEVMLEEAKNEAFLRERSK